jgi:hypothetical protein
MIAMPPRAALAIAVVLAGCGRTDLFDRPLQDPEPRCRKVCQRITGELSALGVDEPCSEPAWKSRRGDCAACLEVVAELYAVEVSPDVCIPCEAPLPAPACGVPAPECDPGTRPEVLRCEGTMCGECDLRFSGRCLPCL